MSKTLPSDRSLLSLPDLDQIAIQTKLVVRQSQKFSPDAFLCSLLEAVSSGKGSGNQIASHLGDRLDRSMARQSMHDRFTEKSTAFLVAVHANLLEQRYRPAHQAFAKQTLIKRVFTEDCTGIALPKSNALTFPAHGNHHGATAGVKIDFAYDLLSGEVITHSLEEATRQDRSIGKEALTKLRPGDLVQRDMGFFILSEFSYIEEQGAFWQSRLPLNVEVILKDGRVLEKRLRRAKEKVVDLQVLAGKAEQKNCRLVAVRAHPKVARERRKQRRQQARSKGKTPSRIGLVRDGWHLMLTNLTAEQASSGKLMSLYRSRWAIEIQFRAWKQSLNLAGALNRKSNRDHLEALILAGLIAHQLGMRMAQKFTKQVGRDRLSFEKLYDLLANFFIKLVSLRRLMDFSPDLRHITRDRRRRQSPIESGLMHLT